VFNRAGICNSIDALQVLLLLKRMQASKKHALIIVIKCIKKDIRSKRNNNDAPLCFLLPKMGKSRF